MNFFRSSKPSGSSIPEPPASSSTDAAPPIQVTRLDFLSYELPEYSHRTAIVIDNLFTPDDCQRLLTAAESKSEWVPAKLNAGGDKEYYDNTYRNSGRILHDDFELADWILVKLRPHLTDIENIEGASRHMSLKRWVDGKAPEDNGAHLLRLNERLRFLRYGPGEFFKPHVDGSYVTPDRKQVSYYTLQIYLNGDKRSLKGGATRFWSRSYNPWSSRPSKQAHKYVDVESRLGRVLIFEHAGLMHSGEEVIQGLKYSMRTDFMYAENEKEEGTAVSSVR